MGVEPGLRARGAIAVVCRIGEDVALVLVDHQRGLYAKRFEGVPKFVGLRRGALAVGVANEDERWRFYFFDESDRGALGIDLRIVIDGFAEERNHPLIDFVFAVVALA